MAISDIVKGAGERQLRERAEAGIRVKQALRGVRETVAKTMGEVSGTAEAGVTALGFGYLRGRYGADGDRPRRARSARCRAATSMSGTSTLGMSTSATA